MIKCLSYPLYFFGGTAIFGLIAGVALYAAEAGFFGDDGISQKKVSLRAEGKEFPDEPGNISDSLLKNSDESAFDDIEKHDDDVFEADGDFRFGITYGKSRFTKKSYRKSPDDVPHSLVINNGFVPENEYKLLVQGHAGKRLTVYVDHDSKRENKEENKYVVQYRAVKDDEILREFNAGDIDIAGIGSRYALFESHAEKAYGMDLTVKKGNTVFKAFGSIVKGEAEVETFKGNSSPGSISIADYQFIRNRYYQLEPYRRFDGITSASSVTSLGLAMYTSLISFTSQPPSPASYIPYTVMIEQGSVEIWVDKQSGTVTNGVFSNAPDGGQYIRMYEGSDYSINYTTGEITFHTYIEEAYRIIAAYRLAGGSVLSSDPSSRNDIVPGKIFVFIKYGSLIEEDIDHDGASNGDINKDGVINHDVYELRSRYSMLDKGILPDSLRIDLYSDNRIVSEGIISKVGRFDADCPNGILKYYVREPFRPLMSSRDSAVIYGVSSQRTYESSHYTHKLTYYRDARVFQLKNMNIVEGSVSVKVNGVTMPPSLYSVNHLTGTIEFSNPNNPMIGETTLIEIRYQYSTQGGVARGFTGGVRGDYRVNDMISFGGTMLYSKQGTDERIPNPGEEPTMTAVFETDVTAKISSGRISSFASALTGGRVREVPIEMTAYSEIARSYRKNNTFGKAVVDDIENAADIISPSLTERDWILSSLGGGGSRGLLYYKYYRNPSSPEALKDESFSAYNIDYSVKAGPYNVAAGHSTYSSKDMNNSRTSLVFDFDFSLGDSVSAAVPIDKKETDLSGLQYVEIWYRASAGAGNAQLSLDAGVINEDSDGDGVLDSEDTNRNGYLDSGEDIGYSFNPFGGVSTRVGNGPMLNSYTAGDGILSTEDLNGNGMLDTADNVLSFPGPKAFSDNSASYQPWLVNLADTEWKSTRIYLRRGNLSESERITLSRARVVRINIKKGTGTTGRIMIDSIRFVSAKWRDVRINNISSENPDQFKVTVVDTWNDSEYNAHSFVREKGSLYEKLYGNRNDDEMNDESESALSIGYNLGGLWGSVSRIFIKSMDISKYRTLLMWVNPREFFPGDRLRIIIGSSENDFMSYESNIDSAGTWQELSFKLADKSGGNIAASQIVGYPELSCIRFMKVEVLSSGSGRLWINNIMVSDPVSSTGSAYWTEGSIKAIRPLYVTDSGIPVVENFTVTYSQRSHSSDYASPGRTDFGTYEKMRDMRASFTVIPRLEVVAAASSRQSEILSLNDSISIENRGWKDESVYLVQMDYLSVDTLIPSINLAYRNEQKNIERNEILLTGGKSGLGIGYTTHAPKISIEERIDDFIGGRWIFGIVSDNVFQSKSEKRSGSVLIKEDESRQKNNLKMKVDYELGYFSLVPEVGLYNHEILYSSMKNSSEVMRNPGGDYHFPFFGNADTFRFSERNVLGSFQIGTRKTEIFSPRYKVEYIYKQHGFKDYQESEIYVHPEYMRMHNVLSTASTDIILPLTYTDPQFGFLKSVTLKFGRKVFCDEFSVPYQGEGAGLIDEQYGMSRSLSSVDGAAFNIARYYPGFFLRGRGNFGRGRDFTNNTLNSKIAFSSAEMSQYTNNMKVMENVSFSPVFQFNGCDINQSFGYDFLSERSSVGAVPGEQITWNVKNDVGVDLMKIFSWGFFRTNRTDNEKHGAKVSFGYSFSQTDIITKNIQERKNSPSIGLTFLWGVSSLSTKGSVDFRAYYNRNFISPEFNERNRKDDFYWEAMNSVLIDEKNRGYTFSVKYDTQTDTAKKILSLIYPLSINPLFTLEFEYIKNQYDYKYTVSPEPYDRKMIASTVKMDVHKNIKGAVTARSALERWYRRDTHVLDRQVFSYEIGMNLSIQF